jgi:hypothetical protein
LLVSHRFLAVASSAAAVVSMLLWFSPANAVDLYDNESQRLRRVVGFSDLAVLATVAQVDTFGFRDMLGDPAVGTVLNLQVERGLMGPMASQQLPVKGPDVLSEKSEHDPMLDPFGSIERATGIKPGMRGIFLLHADPKNRCWALTPAGVFEVRGDTIVVESLWGGRRWLQNVSLPLVQEGVDVGSHITIEDVARWLSLVEQKRILGIAQRRATFVAEVTLLGYIPQCEVPHDMRCFRAGVEQVFAVDRDSVARSDGPRQASPLNETGIALDHLTGTRVGEAIKVMLPGYFLDWGRARMLLLLEPGPTGSNVWVPALDGFGAQPIVGGVLARCNLPAGK